MGEINTMNTIVLDTKYDDVPFRVICVNEGLYKGKFRAIIYAFGIQTSVQETIGGAVDRAIANIQKQLNGQVK